MIQKAYLLNREWLEDYQAKESEEFEIYKKKFVLAGKPILENPYPRKERFPKLREPVANLFTRNIWSQIPLFGSSIIPLMPYTKEKLISMYGLSNERGIEQLAELARTGKLCFVLGSSPLSFAELDYLEPILKEFNPPYVSSLSKLVFDQSLMLKYEEEYRACIYPNFVPLISFIQRHESSSHIDHLLGAYAVDYAVLRALGYDDNAQELLNLMIDDPGAAYDLYTIYGALIANPFTNPISLTYGAISNIDKSYLIPKETSSRTDYEGIKKITNSRMIGSEIGQFLLKKLTFLPESYEACLDVIARYKQEDLESVLKALQDGCMKNDVDLVTKKTLDAEMILDNLWKDARMSNLTRGINFGFSIGLGVVGAIIGGPIGGVGGLLAGLGFSNLDKAIPKFSGKLAKTIVPNHLVAINDFKEKYRVPS